MRKALSMVLTSCVAWWFIATGAVAQQLTPQEEKEGWVSLFDGKTFTGWRFVGGDGSNWKVQDGMLVLTGGGIHIATELEYDDFVLRFEWRAQKPGYDSGLFIRSGYNVGANQIQMAQGGIGSLGGVQGARAVPDLQKPPGQWNSWEVACIGDKVRLVCNGKVAWEGTGLKPASGYIGIQGEGHHFDFRNIRIKELGFKTLFNGKDLTGWQLSNPNATNWVVRDGVLVNEKSGANIMTEEKFMNFRLRYEYMIPAGGNSGVYLRGRYEIQILDDAGKPPAPNGNGAVYGQFAPKENASKPAGQWQTVDVILIGKRVTVILNGKKIHEDVEIKGPTPGGLGGNENEPGPIFIQGDHGPVSFRNIRIKILQ